MLGSFDASRLGKKRAKKAAKALGRDYIRAGGPGQPRLIESPLIMERSTDMTWMELGELPPAEEEAGAAPRGEDASGDEQLLRVLLDEVLEGQNETPALEAPAQFVDAVRPEAVKLQAEGVSVERQMVGVFGNVRQNPETHGLSDEELWRVVAAVFAQLIREGSLHR
jgi:hypothetical protein